MRSRSSFIFRLILKIIALAMYITLLFDFGFGQLYHEIAGLIVCALVVVGLITDFSSMRRMRTEYKQYTLATCDSILLATATLIAVEMVIILVCGLLNSSALLDGETEMTAYALHTIAAYLLPATMAVRIAAQFLSWTRCRKENAKKSAGK